MQKGKKFNKEIKKLEKDYDQKIKKDNYQQIKKSEEFYLKEKNNKLTWNLIQQCDYDTFLLNDDTISDNKKLNKKKNINTIQSNLDDIFVNQSNILFEKDDEDFINNVYSNQRRRQRQNYDNIYNSRISSQKKGENFVKNSHISIGSNRRYQLGKKY